MRSKFAIGILVVLTCGFGLWCWLQPTAPPAVPTSASINPPQPVQHKRFPLNQPYMNVVTGKQLRPDEPSTVPNGANWNLIQTIANPSADYWARMHAVNAFSSRLSDADWDSLRKFLLKTDTLDNDSIGQVLKNNLMTALCVINPPPSGLGDLFVQIYRDHKQDEVIRDYAVQHLGQYYEQMSGRENSDILLQSVQSVLWDAVNEPVGSVGGTALLTLKRLSDEFPGGFDRERIRDTAMRMAGNPIAGELAHITAFQICAQMSASAALPLLLEASANGQTMTERISATGSLGLLGGPDQIPYLNRIIQGPEDRLRLAAQHALAQIAARHN